MLVLPFLEASEAVISMVLKCRMTPMPVRKKVKKRPISFFYAFFCLYPLELDCLCVLITGANAQRKKVGDGLFVHLIPRKFQLVAGEAMTCCSAWEFCKIFLHRLTLETIKRIEKHHRRT